MTAVPTPGALTALSHAGRLRRARLVAVALLTAGCAPAKVSTAYGPRQYVPADYEQVLDRWTREEQSGSATALDPLLHVAATYESWDFRWAYVVRYAHDYRLTTIQRRELLDRTLAQSASVHEFYVALYGTKWRWSDLTRAESSWVVRLIDDRGNETAPTQLTRLKPGPLETRYFPYTTVWRQAFRVTFPTASSDGRSTVAPESRWFGLRFAGPQGTEELRWEREESAAGEPVATERAVR